MKVSGQLPDNIKQADVEVNNLNTNEITMRVFNGNYNLFYDFDVNSEFDKAIAVAEELRDKIWIASVHKPQHQSSLRGQHGRLRRALIHKLKLYDLPNEERAVKIDKIIKGEQ